MKKAVNYPTNSWYDARLNMVATMALGSANWHCKLLEGKSCDNLLSPGKSGAGFA